MKKRQIIHTILFSLIFVLSSCLGSDEEVLNSPYAALRYFSLDEMIRYESIKTDAGKDSLIKYIVPGEYYPFIIDQKAKRVYNPNPLPYNTDVSKVTAVAQNDGALYVYNDSVENFEYFSSSDSLDYTKPRRFMVASLDGTYKQEYTITVNVYDKEPEAISWRKVQAPSAVMPLSMVQLSDKIYLFSKQSDGAPVAHTTTMAAGLQWSDAQSLATLPANALLENVVAFDGKLYVSADNALYSSTNGIEWANVGASRNISSLLLATDDELWALSGDSVVCSTDAADFSAIQPLTDKFPVKNISSAKYPLRTNPYITRNLLIGYPEGLKNIQPVVWGKLSGEQGWVDYSEGGNVDFSCPSFDKMAVLYYDNRLFAFGGAAKRGDEEIAAFSNFYISSDNGLTWIADIKKAMLPSELLGSEASFAAMVDSDKYIWIVSGGENCTVWRGILNRFAYETEK
ncbi:MAG: hypothetical protein IKA41_05575 [Bacteroidaceae bacterium]|nr:hypothetical protein [Bacteroidaceae bacterium]